MPAARPMFSLVVTDAKGVIQMQDFRAAGSRVLDLRLPSPPYADGVLPGTATGPTTSVLTGLHYQAAYAAELAEDTTTPQPSIVLASFSFFSEAIRSTYHGLRRLSQLLWDRT